MTDDADLKPPHSLYVGYLGVPRTQALFLAVAVPLALGAIGVGAVGLAVSQPAWGDAVWDTANVVEITGEYRSLPYPMVHRREPDGSIQSHLLVRVGKLGAASVLSSESNAWLDGTLVTAQGWRLERDGRRMIELDLNDDSASIEAALRTVDEPSPFTPRELELRGAEPVTIRGEIVDAKCFLGAMKPGRGRGHKACATLCVSGGIPPVLYSLDAEGRPRYHLLVDESGRGLTGERLDELLPLVGEPVSITGAESRAGSCLVLRTTHNKIQPL